MVDISIIIPVYNVRMYVEKCIQSVLNQTYKDIEVICVDDGSTDGSGEICDEYAKMDSRVKVIHQNNGGVVSARKKGLKAAIGKFVGFVDSDDWIDPYMYEYMAKKMKDYSVALVEIGIIDCTCNGEKRRKCKIAEGCYKGNKFVKEIIPKLFYDGYFYSYGAITGALWNKLFVRELITEIYMQLDDTEIRLEDMVSVYPYILENQSVYISNEYFYYYRAIATSSKRNYENNVRDVLQYGFNRLEKYVLKTKYSNELLRQLDYCKLFYFLMWCPENFDTKSDILTAFGGFKPDSKIILYGAGSVGIFMYNYLIKKGVQIYQWVDSNYQYICDKYPVSDPKTLELTLDIPIVISVLKYSAVQDISRALINQGIDKNRIRWIKEEYLDDPKVLLSYVNK